MWWEVHEQSYVKFHGLAMPSKKNTETINLSPKYLDICNDLPQCIRPMSFWLAYATKKLVVSPILQTVNFQTGPDTFFEHNEYQSTAVADAVITTCCLLICFLSFVIISPNIIGMLAMCSFGFLPIINPMSGLMRYDTVILGFWACLCIYLKENTLKLEKTFPLILTVIFGTLIFENTGFSLSVSLFSLHLMRKYHGINFNFKKLAFISFVTWISTLSIELLLAYRHADTFWIQSVNGGGISNLHRFYGKYNQFFYIFIFCFKILIPALILTFLILVGKLVRKEKDSGLPRLPFLHLSLLIGFFACVLVGRFVSGLGSEWPRQLLPFCYLTTICLAQILPDLRFKHLYEIELEKPIILLATLGTMVLGNIGIGIPLALLILFVMKNHVDIKINFLKWVGIALSLWIAVMLFEYIIANGREKIYLILEGYSIKAHDLQAVRPNVTEAIVLYSQKVLVPSLIVTFLLIVKKLGLKKQ